MHSKLRMPRCKSHWATSNSLRACRRASSFADLRLLAQDAEELLKATADDLSDKAKEARAKLKVALEKARVSAHQWEDKAAAGARATDKVIRDHPYQSVGIAFGIGVLLSALINRR